MNKRAQSFAIIVAVFCATLCLSGCRDANAWIKKLSFQPINPPSNLLAPGAIVMRRHGFGQIRLLCTAEESLGENFKASQSRTIGGRFSRGRQVGWKVSGDALKQIKLAANSDSVESVHVKVSQARIENLTDTDVLLALSRRSPACAAAMRKRRTDGWELSMITRCLRADVSYGIQFKDEASLDLQAKIANLQAVNVALGGSFQSTSDRTANASNLIWGASDDKYLASIGSDDADVVALRGQSPVPSKRQSLFMPDETLTTDETTQTDDGPSWGITTEPAASEAIPGAGKAFESATAKDERTGQQIDEDDYQDMLDAQESAGFVPSEGGAPIGDQPEDEGPLSPRSSRRK